MLFTKGKCMESRPCINYPDPCVVYGDGFTVKAITLEDDLDASYCHGPIDNFSGSIQLIDWLCPKDKKDSWGVSKVL
jgi:hypothetical protein